MEDGRNVYLGGGGVSVFHVCSHPVQLYAQWSSAGRCLGIDSETISHMNPGPKLAEFTRFQHATESFI